MKLSSINHVSFCGRGCLTFHINFHFLYKLRDVESENRRIIVYFLFLYSKSIFIQTQTSIFPTELLKGHFKLIHKSGIFDIDNFRVLTLLSSLSTVFVSERTHCLPEQTELLQRKSVCLHSSFTRLPTSIRSNEDNKGQIEYKCTVSCCSICFQLAICKQFLNEAKVLYKDLLLHYKVKT